LFTILSPTLSDNATMQAPTVDTLLLSDIHLGSEISRAREALVLLKSCGFRRLILLGDIFSDLNFARLNGDHWKFLSYIRKLSNRKRKIEVVWVEGNHDQGLSNVMSHLVGVPVFKRYVWTYNGLLHLAIHGHQFDRFALDNEFLSRAGELLFSRVQKLDMRNKRFSRFVDRLNSRWLRLSTTVAESALAYAKAGRIDRIFCGHTHLPQHRQYEGVDYYNTGAWVDQRPTYVTVGDEGVAIHEYEGGTNDRHSGEERKQMPADAVDLFEQAGLPTLGAYESIRC
jgi:UDP-2,3-diacylglucosamine pyrophosphatase LpxH